MIIAGAWTIDRLLGDPARFHPVAGFGSIAAVAERLTWRPNRGAGVLHTVALVGAASAGAALIDRALRARPRALFVSRLAVLWVTLGGRSLERAALALASALRAGNIEAARGIAPSLVGRDPTALDAHELSRAAIESVAENTSDAVVAPLLWYALLGVPGAVMYRAANTLDAMIGHRSERYLRFGWAAARLDDILNWPAARFTALLTILAAPATARAAAWRGAWIQGAAHPSPNAGRVEGAFAGALGIRLGGVNRYPYTVEARPQMGTGQIAGIDDVDRAVVLARRVQMLTVLVCAGLAWCLQR